LPLKKKPAEVAGAELNFADGSHRMNPLCSRSHQLGTMSSCEGDSIPDSFLQNKVIKIKSALPGLIHPVHLTWR
jgi:hypothetical protein